jgi:hypothetical protein
VKNVWWVVIVLFLCRGTFGTGFRDGHYTIPESSGFDSAAIPLNGAGLIRAENGNSLVRVDSIAALKPGQLLLRHKDGNSYSFYRGVLDTSAFSKKPDVYIFTFPGWAVLKEITRYRLYRAPTESNGIDEPDIFFDNERIYVNHFAKLYYFRNNNWFSIIGSTELFMGGIRITTDPPGAKVIINGAATDFTTPCLISRLIPGVYTFELFLPDYHLFHKTVKIYPGDTISGMFELLSNMDTVYITGNAPHGVLILPQPPTDSSYEIDSVKIYSLTARLLPGEHRLRWNGDLSYESIDTAIYIDEGTLHYFDYLFKRRFGVLRVTSSPPDAEICIEGQPCHTGEQVMEVPSGTYEIKAFRNGFVNLKKQIPVMPDSLVHCDMNLLQRPDRDGDGFIDSVDECPDKYGLYSGCPNMKFVDALQIKQMDVREFVKNDPFTFSTSLLGFILKMPTNRTFTNFISTFSSGKIGGVNNYRGLTVGNNLTVQYHGLYGAVELGQWTSGLRYHRLDTLRLTGDNSEHLVFYDSLRDVEPTMYIPSTTVMVGLHYNWSWINVIYALGYQWEDLILNDFYNTKTGSFDSFTFDNDWWFHQLCLEINFIQDQFFVPSTYFKIKLPFGSAKKTRWHVLQAGIQLKIVPEKFKKG